MAKNQFPMFDVDALLKQFTAPNAAAKAIMESQKKNFEALVAANQKIAESMQKIAQEEQQMIQNAISDWTAAAGGIAPQGDVQEQSSQRTEAAIKAVEDGIRHMRTFTELVAQAQAESIKILSNRMDESLEELRQQVGETSGKSPKAKK